MPGAVKSCSLFKHTMQFVLTGTDWKQRGDNRHRTRTNALRQLFLPEIINLMDHKCRQLLRSDVRSATAVDLPRITENTQEIRSDSQRQAFVLAEERNASSIKRDGAPLPWACWPFQNYRQIRTWQKRKALWRNPLLAFNILVQVWQDSWKSVQDAPMLLLPLKATAEIGRRGMLHPRGFM